mmetsp:Transcript_16926/g.46832  ORF Transcript_16926/g.46832 Transcript_16926/m.46832 type:complete len:414 (-) Transcript_16926:270-1511(-)
MIPSIVMIAFVAIAAPSRMFLLLLLLLLAHNSLSAGCQHMKLQMAIAQGLEDVFRIISQCGMALQRLDEHSKTIVIARRVRDGIQPFVALLVAPQDRVDIALPVILRHGCDKVERLDIVVALQRLQDPVLLVVACMKTPVEESQLASTRGGDESLRPLVVSSIANGDTGDDEFANVPVLGGAFHPAHRDGDVAETEAADLGKLQHLVAVVDLGASGNVQGLHIAAGLDEVLAQGLAMIHERAVGETDLLRAVGDDDAALYIDLLDVGEGDAVEVGVVDERKQIQRQLEEGALGVVVVVRDEEGVDVLEVSLHVIRDGHVTDRDGLSHEDGNNVRLQEPLPVFADARRLLAADHDAVTNLRHLVLFHGLEQTRQPLGIPHEQLPLIHRHAHRRVHAGAASAGPGSIDGETHRSF